MSRGPCVRRPNGWMRLPPKRKQNAFPRPSPWLGCTCCRIPLFRSGPRTILPPRFRRCCSAARRRRGRRKRPATPCLREPNRNHARRAARPDIKRRRGKLPWAFGSRMAIQTQCTLLCCGMMRVAAGEPWRKSGWYPGRVRVIGRDSRRKPAIDPGLEFRLVRSGRLGRWPMLVRRPLPQLVCDPTQRRFRSMLLG